MGNALVTDLLSGEDGPHTEQAAAWMRHRCEGGDGCGQPGPITYDGENLCHNCYYRIRRMERRP